MRHAIALFITLFFVAALTALVGVNLGYVQEAFKQDSLTKRAIQSNILANDVIEYLKKEPLLKEIESSDDFSQLLTMYNQINLDFAKDFSLGITIDAYPVSQFNINTLEAKNKDQVSQFVEYLRLNGVQDADRFVDMVLDVTNTAAKVEFYKTSIFEDNPTMQRKGIFSYYHFEQIIAYYIDQTDDKNILRVPWHTLVQFSPTTVQKLNYNTLTRPVRQLLFLQDNYEEQQDVDAAEVCDTLDDIGLSIEEKRLLELFHVECKAWNIRVKLAIKDEHATTNVTFNYEINGSTPSEFRLEL
jgi:hypothetical protein